MSEIPPDVPPVSSPSAAPAPRSFGERVVGALRLDASVYEEVENDAGALPQAAAVIALAAVAEGLGAAHAGFGSLVGGVVSAFLGWGVGTAIVWGIGVKAMGHTSDFPELLRTLGFASAPKLLLVLGVLPLGPLRPFLVLAVMVLMLIAFVIAVRQALDVETGRAVLVCVLAVGAAFLLAVILGGLLGAGA